MTEEQRDLEEEYFLSEQPLDEEEKALRDLIYDRLEIFTQNNKPVHDRVREDRQIIRMEDPYQDDEQTILNNGKKTLQLQSLKSTINNVVADQMLSMPEAKLLPETLSMQDAADDLQDMVHYVIYCANDFEHTHYRLCEDFYGSGTMVLQTAWDQDMNYGKGDIALIRWPMEAFLWDNMADNIQDCRAVMKVSWHPLSWFRAHFPDNGKYVGAEESSHDNVGMITDESHPSDERRAMLIEYWWREYNAKTHRYSINVAYAAGQALLSVHKDVYNHGLYPFSILAHDSIEGSIAGNSLTHELAPMMRYINRYAAYADMNARMSSKGRMLVRRESGIDKDALTDWTVDVIEGDNIIQGEAWNWMQNQPFNSTITNLMTMFQSDLKQDSGANQFTRGETTGGIVSGKAINSLIQAGGKISSMRTEQIKFFFKDVVEQIIWLMSQFYEDDRIILITGREGRRELKVDTKKLFGKKSKSITPPPYSVQIEVSSRDPQRIANQNQMFMEAYTMAAQAQQFFPLSSLMQILNLDGKDKILPVIKENEHYQEQMQALQQQLAEMQAQMQGMQEQNEALKKTGAELSDSLSNIVSQKAPASKMGEANSSESPSAIVESARNMMGVPTGAALPT